MLAGLIFHFVLGIANFVKIPRLVIFIDDHRHGTVKIEPMSAEAISYEDALVLVFVQELV